MIARRLPVGVVPDPQPIPALKGVPLLGSYPRYRRDPLGFYLLLARRYGDISAFRLFALPHLFINAPELIQSLLVEHAHDYDKGRIQHALFQPLVGNGLVNSEGAVHQRQRQLLAPLFQPRHLARYAETMVAYADRWQAHCREDCPLDLHGEMMGLTMAVVAKVLLGVDLGPEVEELGAAINTGVEWFQRATTSVLPLPLGTPTPLNRRTQRALTFIRQRVQAIIWEHEARDSTQTRPAGDLLAVLVRARAEQAEQGPGLSARQLLDEVLTFFLAGHETTALALTWTFYLLARHPEVTRRLHDEVDAVLGRRLPTYADLPHLPYTLQVLKEAMRLYPPSSAILRVACRDTVLGERYPIPQGTAVLFSQYVLHRRPDTFPEPTRFEPTRFEAAREQALPRYAYLPFGAGHRICIGNHFALMEGQLLLATIARSRQVTLVEPREAVRPALMLTLRPSRPILVRVRPRGG